MFPRDMVCLRNISVDTLREGDAEDDDDNNNNDSCSLFMLKIVFDSKRQTLRKDGQKLLNRLFISSIFYSSPTSTLG
jgi:hypothetical protein